VFFAAINNPVINVPLCREVTEVLPPLTTNIFLAIFFVIVMLSQFRDIIDFSLIPAFLLQILMALCANVVVLGPAMGFGYSAVAEPAMRAAKTDGDLQLDANQANWMGWCYKKFVPSTNFL